MPVMLIVLPTVALMVSVPPINDRPLAWAELPTMVALPVMATVLPAKLAPIPVLELPLTLLLPPIRTV